MLDNQPFDAIDQCISIFAGSTGLLDDLKLSDVHEFEDRLLDYFRSSMKDLRDQLIEKQSFKGLEEQFKKAMIEFKTKEKFTPLCENRIVGS